MGQMTEWGLHLKNKHGTIYLLIISNDENKVASSLHETEQLAFMTVISMVTDGAERNVVTLFLPLWYFYSCSMALPKQKATESSHRKNCRVTFVNFLWELWHIFLLNTHMSEPKYRLDQVSAEFSLNSLKTSVM